MADTSKLLIDRVAVIGTRKKAQQIAETVSSAGIEVTILGPDQERTARAVKGIASSIDREIQRWGMTEADKKVIMSRISSTTNMADLADCAIVIEATGRTMEEKRQVLREVEQYCPEVQLYVVHVSTVSVTEVMSGSAIARRALGMHFQEPVSKIPVVELVRGMNTDDDCVELAKEFTKRLGKTSVEVSESPGYITNRVLLPMINEAIFVLMEGVSTAVDIDAAIKFGFNLPMGPLAMADMIGLDEVLRRLEYLFYELQDFKFRPCPLLRKMVRAGRLGRSTGEGFFQYERVEEEY